MPIYEYECEKCACRFELKRRFDEDAGSPCCPQCQGKVRQLFSPSAVLFKGSGFYVTDSRKESKVESEKKEEGKTEKAEGVKKETGQTEKTEISKKEEGKPDKVEGSKQEAGKTEKAEGIKKEEGKADKVENSKKKESK
jgi:putative FmdB family regulatory protein